MGWRVREGRVKGWIPYWDYLQNEAQTTSSSHLASLLLDIQPPKENKEGCLVPGHGYNLSATKNSLHVCLVLAHAAPWPQIIQTDTCTCIVKINMSQKVLDKEPLGTICLFFLKYCSRTCRSTE